MRNAHPANLRRGSLRPDGADGPALPIILPPHEGDTIELTSENGESFVRLICSVRGDIKLPSEDVHSYIIQELNAMPGNRGKLSWLSSLMFRVVPLTQHTGHGYPKIVRDHLWVNGITTLLREWVVPDALLKNTNAFQPDKFVDVKTSANDAAQKFSVSDMQIMVLPIKQNTLGASQPAMGGNAKNSAPPLLQESEETDDADDQKDDLSDVGETKQEKLDLARAETYFAEFLQSKVSWVEIIASDEATKKSQLEELNSERSLLAEIVGSDIDLTPGLCKLPKVLEQEAPRLHAKLLSYLKKYEMKYVDSDLAFKCHDDIKKLHGKDDTERKTTTALLKKLAVDDKHRQKVIDFLTLFEALDGPIKWNRTKSSMPGHNAARYAINIYTRRWAEIEHDVKVSDHALLWNIELNRESILTLLTELFGSLDAAKEVLQCFDKILEKHLQYLKKVLKPELREKFLRWDDIPKEDRTSELRTFAFLEQYVRTAIRPAANLWSLYNPVTERTRPPTPAEKEARKREFTGRGTIPASELNKRVTVYSRPPVTIDLKTTTSTEKRVVGIINKMVSQAGTLLTPNYKAQNEVTTPSEYLKVVRNVHANVMDITSSLRQEMTNRKKECRQKIVDIRRVKAAGKQPAPLNIQPPTMVEWEDAWNVLLLDATVQANWSKSFEQALTIVLGIKRPKISAQEFLNLPQNLRLALFCEKAGKNGFYETVYARMGELGYIDPVTEALNLLDGEQIE